MSELADDGVRQFRVYVEQVNQTYVDVSARSEAEAYDKGYAKWRREYAHSRVSYVEEVQNEGETK